MDSILDFNILTLPSDANLDLHPDNKAAHYVTEYTENYDLPGGAADWEAAILDVSLPHAWVNVKQSTKLLFLLVNPSELVSSRTYVHADGTKPSNEDLERLATKHLVQNLKAESSRLNELCWEEGQLAETRDLYYAMYSRSLETPIFAAFRTNLFRALKNHPAVFVYVPKGFYAGIEGLCAFIQDEINSRLEQFTAEAKIQGPRSAQSKKYNVNLKTWNDKFKNQEVKVKVRYDCNTKKVAFQLPIPYFGYMLASSVYLQKLLGLEPAEISFDSVATEELWQPEIGHENELSLYLSEAVESKNAVNAMDAHANIYVYSNLCKPQRVGSVFRQLLGVFPVPGSPGEQVVYKFPEAHYLPLAVDSLRMIEMQLGSDEGGELVPFLDGAKVICRVAVRRRRSGI